MKKTDEQLLIETFDRLGIKYDKWTGKSYIYSTALVLGAVVEYTVKGANFNFDKDGKFVGSANEAINSFSLPFSKVCIKEVT